MSTTAMTNSLKPSRPMSKAMIDINSIHKVHFIGVGGIGMSGLARHFLHEKKHVSGSDRALSDITKKLAEEGVHIFAEQVASNIAKDIDLIVYTEAMSADHEEIVAARALGVPMVNYFEALGIAMNPYYLIAVAGTHGKTTTTAMITEIFETAEKDPTAVIGSLRAKTQSNYRAGKSKYAIVEACEYRRDFLHLKPDVLVITNIELDHVDYYKSLADVQDAFRELIMNVNEGGVVITDTKHPNIASILVDCPVPVIDYVSYFNPMLELKLPGIHNRLNAAAALAVSKQEKIPQELGEQALAQFTGTWRRFEYKGLLNGAHVFDDYAHHPTAVTVTLQAVHEAYPDKRVVAVFEPHMVSRTAVLFKEFARSFAGADKLYLVPIYGARKDTTVQVTSRELAVQALEFAPETQYVESLEAAEQILRKSITKDDVVIVMGAGTVTELATALVRNV